MSAASVETARPERDDEPTDRETRPNPPEGQQLDTPVLLARWMTVFPLSRGPAHRVRLSAGPDINADVVAAVTADYARELSERVPRPFTINDAGDLFGPRDVDGAPHDVLFTAVFTTDLEAIVRRHVGAQSSAG